jgi:glutamate synthase (ferredoxin)
MSSGLPARQGLYDPQNEHDSCGVGFLVDLKGRKSHRMVRDGLTALWNLNHRGACGCENNTGDGAGILIQIPHEFLVRRCRPLGIELPEPGAYGVGAFFTSTERGQQEFGKRLFEEIVAEEGQRFLGWRRLKTDNSSLGESARAVEPAMFHALIGSSYDDPDRFERKLFVIRKRFESVLETSGLDDHKFFYFASLSCRTLVYKGMLTTEQLGTYFADDLDDEGLVSALCLFHSRFSTNTFPSWELAHPYRMIAHNGEINTLRGNINWMRAREALFASDLYEPGDVEKLLPIHPRGPQRHACLDNAVELLVKSGFGPGALDDDADPRGVGNHETMSQAKKGLLRLPQLPDGAVGRPRLDRFTDGTSIGAVLDRNGLRPAATASPATAWSSWPAETGVLNSPPRTIVQQGRLEPGQDVPGRHGAGPHRRRRGAEARIAAAQPTASGSCEFMVPLDELPEAPHVPGPRPRDPPAPPAGLRLHPGGHQVHPRPDGLPTARRRSARWGRTPPWPSCPTGRSRSSTTSSSCSRR